MGANTIRATRVTFARRVNRGRRVDFGGRGAPIDPKVEFLRQARAYPDRPDRVEVIETHMSWVFLTEGFAYKLKKPIRYDVLDFSTVELRRESCRRELLLNRRLAPDTYLEVIPLTLRVNGQLAVGGTGVPVDWMVKMRRLPAERMLDRLIRAGTVRRGDVKPAARLLARFYQGARPAAIDGTGYRTHLREGLLADRRALVQPLYRLPVADVLSLTGIQLRYLEERAATVESRCREGRVVEGHGDLRPEHICLTDPPAVIDCLEFSRDLRIQDPADELSFLALECSRLGAPEVGGWFLDFYRTETGDDPPPDLLRFYCRLRALRRAKIAAWHVREPDADHPEKWRQRARWYLTAGLREGQGRRP